MTTQPPAEPRPTPPAPPSEATARSAQDTTATAATEDTGAAADKHRHAQEKRAERYMWWYLAYFLFGIHIVAFVMIFAVRHGK
jgi:heme/copper-type cytochrome/quinol oxidase subunit 3